MITRCLCCGRYYWRYRDDFPPALFCSWACAELARALPPPEPEAVLAEMLLHLRMEHAPRDWWKDVLAGQMEAFGKNPLLFARPADCDECWELELLSEVAA